MADSIWDGVFIRGNIGEGGTVPHSASSNSPDIIPYGTSPMGDPSILTSEDFYDTQLSNEIFLGQFNYLYMRGKNMHNGSNKGVFKLYYAQSNLILFPNQWVQLETSDVIKDVPFSVSNQDEIAGTENAFVWNVSQPTQGHYCLIGVVVDDFNSSPVVMTERITDWTEILVKNGNICQRNTKLITDSAADILDEVPYNQGEEAAVVDIAVVCKNFPKGSNFSLSSGKPVPDFGTITVTVNDSQEYNFKKAAVDVPMPAQFVTMFHWTLKLGNDWGDITGVPTVEVRGELVTGTTHRLYKFGRIAGQHPSTCRMRVDETGGPVEVIPFGSFEWTMSGAATRNPNFRKAATRPTPAIKPTLDTSATISALRVAGTKENTKYLCSASSGIQKSESSSSVVSTYELVPKVDMTMEYTQVNISGGRGIPDSPNVAVILDYSQDDSYEEIDLDITWSDVTEGTYMAISSPDYPDFEISKRPVSGNGKYGVFSFDTDPFSAQMELQLWTDGPGKEQAIPQFTVTVSKVVLAPASKEHGGHRGHRGHRGNRNRQSDRAATDLVLLGKAVVQL